MLVVIMHVMRLSQSPHDRSQEPDHHVIPGVRVDQEAEGYPEDDDHDLVTENRGPEFNHRC